MKGLAPPKPIMLKERASMVFLQYGEIDVIDGAFVLIDKNGVRKHIPVGGLACLMLENGTRITHEAIKLASRVGCLILWIGDGGVRLYSAGQPGGARSDRLLFQAKAALDEKARVKVVRKMYELRFGEPPPMRRSILQMQGIEGARVRALYKLIAKQYGIVWNRRSYNPKDWDNSDPLNQAISSATSSLYGICEAGILAAGYSPAIGFVHSGKPQSFVYDIADIFKFDTVIPAAFKVISQGSADPQRDVRIACRDFFRQTKILKRIIPTIDEILHASGLDDIKVAPEAVLPAIPNKEGIGDAGHRN